MITTCDTTPAVQPSSWKAVALAIGSAAALFYLYTFAILTLNYYPPALPPIFWMIVSILSTVGYILIIVYAVRLLSRLVMSARHEVIFLLVSLALFLLLNPLVWQAVALLRRGTGLWELFASLTAGESVSLLASIAPFFLILTGAFFGRLVARLIREVPMLVPVAIVAALIDFWGVYWGFVSQMSENAPAAVSGLGSATTAVANVPEQVTQQVSGALAMLVHLTPPESIGIGDFVFVTLLLTCAYRLGFSAGRVMWGIFTGLLLASLVMALDGLTLFGHDIAISYLPGLVFICGGFLLFSPSIWKLTRQEWLMTAAIIVVLGAAISYSIVTAKMNEPVDEPAVSYTLTPTSADPARETITHELERIRKEHSGLEVMPMAVEILYARKSGGADAKQWGMLVLGRQQRVSIRSTRAYRITAGQLKAGTDWVISRDSISPPQQILRDPIQHKLDDVARIQAATPLPDAAWSTLDHLAEYAKLAQGQRYVVIRLFPNGGAVVNGDGKMLKRLKY